MPQCYILCAIVKSDIHVNMLLLNHPPGIILKFYQFF